jgi:quercetin dioxygenase-like cupin family protein
MLSSKTLESFGLPGATVYDFEFAGDILPKHTHTEDTIHITVVCRGRVKAYSHDWEQEAAAGDILNFRAFEPHEICALEDGSRLVNIPKSIHRQE